MKLAPLFVLLTASAIAVPAMSNPLNPHVVNGSATISQSGNVLTVTNSNGAIINWQQFNIGAGQTTRFVQPAASSTVLNRVLASDPSVILGNLTSNGRVWLVNPAGIFVGQGARIDAAGFVASTLHVSNEDFLAGRHEFVDGGTSGTIVNQGEIRTPAGGSVYLVGTNVANGGIIATPQGEAILAAGATASLSDTTTPGVRVDITGSEGTSSNLGAIYAEAGSIVMAGVNVRNSGVLNAGSVIAAGGRVFLKASQDTYVDGGGRIVATGTSGGDVEVLGNRVAVVDYASIDTSGTNGGGRILVGGDSLGMNPGVQNAGITDVGPNVSLKADATTIGDGGKLIVWANDATRVFGTLTAKGGATSGNGGYIETSGRGSLEISGARIDTSAANGAAGTWRLDANDMQLTGIDNAQFTDQGNAIITASSSINITDSLSGGSSLLTSSDGGGLTLTGGKAASGNLNLTGGNIAIAGGSINLASAASGESVTLTGGTATGGNLTLSGGSIAVTKSNTGPGSITIGGGNIALAGSSSGGSLSLTGGSPAVAAQKRKLLQQAAGAISIRGAPLVQPAVPIPVPTTAMAPAPVRASAPTARLINTGSLVDGAVTVRLSLVDASPIALR